MAVTNQVTIQGVGGGGPGGKSRMTVLRPVERPAVFEDLTPGGRLRCLALLTRPSGMSGPQRSAMR